MESKCDNLADKEWRTGRDRSQGAGRKGERGRGKGQHDIENIWKIFVIKQLFKTCLEPTCLKVSFFCWVHIAYAQSKYSLCRKYGNFTHCTHSQPCVSCFCMQKRRERYRGRERETVLNSEDSKWQQRSVDSVCPLSLKGRCDGGSKQAVGSEIISLSPAEPPVLLSTAVEQILLVRTDWIFVPGSLLC